jgi:hypothetical protein
MANVKISALPTGTATLTASDVMVANIAGTTSQVTIADLREVFFVVDPTSYGAVADGTTSDTTAIQTAINALPEGGIIDGKGRTYNVGRINLHSNMWMRNFNFFVGQELSTDYTCPVTIGDNNDHSVHQNITVTNVFVDGNRGNHSNIAGGEDGGRHGFRIVGKTKNIFIDRCTAIYCASDGIALYGGINTRSGVAIDSGFNTANNPLIKTVTVSNSIFRFNRRLGGSADSIKDCSFINCVFNDNGYSSTGTQTGATGTPPKGGFDFEFYDVGSASDNILFLDCQFMGNASPEQSMITFNPTPQSTTNWIRTERIRWRNCVFGSISSTGTYVMQITSGVADKSASSQFYNVRIEDCTIYGYYVLRNINNLHMTGGAMIRSDTGEAAGTADHISAAYVQSATTIGSRTFSNNSSQITYF